MREKVLNDLGLFGSLLFSARPARAGFQPYKAGGAFESAYHKITAEEAKEKMDGAGALIVDVRTAEEYAAFHIPGAIHLQNESIGGAPPKALPEQDAVLLVYCRSGARSRKASQKLVELGYTQVYDFGGITDWPYDIVSGKSGS